uniref:Uncharacterized protein n=1 Tax=Setaria italica TaxID=4555 RepID=K3YKN8_SETIT
MIPYHQRLLSSESKRQTTDVINGIWGCFQDPNDAIQRRPSRGGSYKGGRTIERRSRRTKRGSWSH